MKKCRSCGLSKPLASFVKQYPNKCSMCRADYKRAYRLKNPEKYDPNKRRKKHLKVAFNMTLGEYEKMLKAQGGKCALCPTLCGHPTRLHIDHDHATGRVRALLCGKCNRGIGLFKENSTLLRRAANYLAAHKKISVKRFKPPKSFT